MSSLLKDGVYLQARPGVRQPYVGVSSRARTRSEGGCAGDELGTPLGALLVGVRLGRKAGEAGRMDAVDAEGAGLVAQPAPGHQIPAARAAVQDHGVDVTFGRRAVAVDVADPQHALFGD